MSSFRLQSGDSDFNSRVDALFNTLQTVAVDLKTPQGSKRPHEDDDEDGKDEFCTPQRMPPWRGGMGRGQGSSRKSGPRNSTPDYVKNPHNWTKYSMKNTKVLSERENKHEGLKLFHDLQSRRMQEEMTHDEYDSVVGHDKIIFKKPVKPVHETDTEMPEVSDKPNISVDALFGGSQKFRMRDYEVGKSKSIQKSKKGTDEETHARKDVPSKEIKLGHLMFEDEDEPE